MTITIYIFATPQLYKAFVFIQNESETREVEEKKPLDKFCYSLVSLVYMIMASVLEKSDDVENNF